MYTYKLKVIALKDINLLPNSTKDNGNKLLLLKVKISQVNRKVGERILK